MRPDRPSFRQVGREKRGKLRSGPLTGQRTGAPTAAASIPSKFETTLCPNTGARKGFGSCAHRFTEVENDLPGPGSYESARAAVRDDRVYSKKGCPSQSSTPPRQRAAPAMRATELLPQASVSALCPRRNARAWCRATTRPLRVRREQPSNAHQPPSPRPHPAVGAYEDPRSFSRELRSRYAAGGGTSSFRPPSQRPVEVVDEPEPGPGAYSARKANLSSYGCAPIPALRSALLPAVRRPMRSRHGSLPSECTSD